MDFLKSKKFAMWASWALISFAAIVFQYNSFADSQREKLAILLGSIHKSMTIEIEKEYSKLTIIETQINKANDDHILVYYGYRNEFNQPMIATSVYVPNRDYKYTKYTSNNYIKDKNGMNDLFMVKSGTEYSVEDIADEMSQAIKTVKVSLQAMVERKYFSEKSVEFDLVTSSCHYKNITCMVDLELSEKAIMEVISRSLKNRTSIMEELKIGKAQIEKDLD